MQSNVWSINIGKLRAGYLVDGKPETQEHLAKELTKLLGRSISREVVNQIESGTRNLKADVIAALAKHFNCTADYILGLTPAPSVDPELSAICKYTGLTQETIETLHGLNDGSGFAAKLLENITVPYDYASPLEQALGLLTQSATAINAENEEIEEWHRGIKRRERAGAVEGFYIENGKYTAENWYVATFLLEQAEACLTSSIGTTLEEVRDEIATQIKSNPNFQVVPWSVKEALEDGE